VTCILRDLESFCGTQFVEFIKYIPNTFYRAREDF